MNITETRVPQDGAIKTTLEGLDLDMRVSSLPTKKGEKIVIRILDYTQSANGLDSLGFSAKLLKNIYFPPNKLSTSDISSPPIKKGTQFSLSATTYINIGIWIKVVLFHFVLPYYLKYHLPSESPLK